MFCLIVHYWENIFSFNYYYHFLEKEVGRRHLCIFKDDIELDINSQLTSLSILLINIISFFSLYIVSIFFITAGYDCLSFPFLLSTDISEEDTFTQKKFSLSSSFFQDQVLTTPLSTASSLFSFSVNYSCSYFSNEFAQL